MVIQLKTYEEEMRKRLEDGRGPRRIESEPTINTKNILPGINPVKTKINVPAVERPTVVENSAPAVGMPAVLQGKDLNPNYTQRMWESALKGDYADAMYNEMMHNEKNGYLGLGYANSHIFNYDDPYRGDLDRQREAIENRDPFSYDYREDDLYKSILSQKEKEADQAYKDGYAQLSRQFDGDIPVNMINKLLTTKGEIIDQADSYIPELRQLAYGMYQDEGNKMLQDYNLTQQAAAEDYDRWRSDRDFIISGIENKYGRDKYDKEFEYSKGIDERNYIEDVRRADRDFDWQKDVDERNFEYAKTVDAIAQKYGVQDVVSNTALSLYNSGKFSSFSAALDAAKALQALYE